MSTRRPARRRPAAREPHGPERASREAAPRATGRQRPPRGPARRDPANVFSSRRASRPAIARAEGGDRPVPSLRLLGLLLVLTVALAVLYPTLRHAVAQREELRVVTAQVQEARERTQDLERRQRLWRDPDYVRAQARDRLGFVMPGETTLVVVDPQAVSGATPRTPEDRAAQAARSRAATAPWYVNIWESIAAAGQADARDPAAPPGQVPTPAPSVLPPPPGNPTPSAEPSAP